MATTTQTIADPSVLPASAGMIPERLTPRRPGSRAPRIRGDDPVLHVEFGPSGGDDEPTPPAGGAAVPRPAVRVDLAREAVAA